MAEEWTPGTCEHGLEKVPLNSHRAAHGVERCQYPDEVPAHKKRGPLAWGW